MVSNPGKLSVENSQLLYQPLDGESIRVPIEDISTIILETKYATLTSALLSCLADAGTVLFSCGDNHIPNGAFHPFHKHSRLSEIAKIQKNWTEPFKKRVWQEIIQSKISNQAYVLKIIGNENSKKLKMISGRVQSGDAKNHEALAARIYWESIFTNFKRGNEDWINSALNYGYAIIRGCIARNITGAGLIGCFGLNHSSGLNAFNLADDLIEPFRAFVDLKIYQLFESLKPQETDMLKPKEKQEIVKILTDLCHIAGEKTSLLNASETIAFSLVSASRTKDYSDIKLPNFLTNDKKQ